jgi:hypothetical protein
MKRQSGKHPANNGRVMLMAWVSEPLRTCVREAAADAGVPVSEWVAKVLLGAVTRNANRRLKGAP